MQVAMVEVGSDPHAALGEAEIEAAALALEVQQERELRRTAERNFEASPLTPGGAYCKRHIECYTMLR